MRRNTWSAIAVVAAGAGIALGAVWFGVAAPRIAAAHALTGYMAKAVCSCLFVEKRGLAGCKADALVDHAEALAPVGLRVGEPGKWVKASLFPLADDEAVYEEGFGCTLR